MHETKREKNKYYNKVYNLNLYKAKKDNYWIKLLSAIDG